MIDLLFHLVIDYLNKQIAIAKHNTSVYLFGDHLFAINVMDYDGRIKAYKFVALAAVTFSTVAVVSVCITLPMVYNYASNIRQTLSGEMNSCKVSVRPSFQINS